MNTGINKYYEKNNIFKGVDPITMYSNNSDRNFYSKEIKNVR